MDTKKVQDLLRQAWRKKWIRQFFAFTSFKAGVVMIVFAVALFIKGGERLKEVVLGLDQRLFDQMFLMRGTRQPTGQVVIVDIDEKSLRELGQWPWPRNKMAKILLNLADAGVTVIGMDIVYAETDQHSPIKYVPLFSKLTGKELELSEEEYDYDVVLADAIAEAPVIVGYVFQMDDDRLASLEQSPPMPEFTMSGKVLKDSGFCLDGVPSAYRPVATIGRIAGEAISEGCFNNEPDATGIVRKVPLFVRFAPPEKKGETKKQAELRMKDVDRQTLYPSLSLEMLREGLKIDKSTIEPLFDRYGAIAALQFGDRELPTDRGLRLSVNYRGGKKTFKYYSAVDILNNTFSAEELAEKYVLIGTSAAGLLDLRATPFESAFPGVEVHANLIDNILAGDPMEHDIQGTQKGAGIFMIILGGLIITAALSYGGAIAGGLCGAGSLIAILVWNYYYFFFNQNKLVGVTFPILALLVIFIAVALVNYFLEGREKRVVRGMFSTMVSGDVLQYMEDHPGSFSLSGEQRHATMFFSDVAGFTTISESLTPEKLVQLLNAYLTPMTEIIMDHQGYVDKYEGDAIMAEWGVPFPSDDHGVLACYAALDQQKYLAEIREDLFQRFGHRLTVRMGMNSGYVSAGNMGSTRRFSYTVMGDAVNQAARFEPANKDYGTDIMMGATTYELAKDFVESRLLDQIIVKGKTKPIMIYELLARKGELEPGKKKAITLYQDALRIHWERKFDKALGMLDEALKACPDDSPAKALIERIQGYKETPPPDTWQGEYVRTSKD